MEYFIISMVNITKLILKKIKKKFIEYKNI